jgi:hypothetical protein
VLGTLDLAFFRPHLAVGQGELLVAATIPYRIEVVADTYQGDAESGDVESLGLP